MGKTEKPVFYLKINKWDGNAACCLKFWLKVVELTNGKYYIICDSPAATRWLNSINQGDYIIPSDREQSEYYIKRINIENPKWKQAFAAHMTTFFHAKEHGYNNFWNIDADDIIMMIPDEKIKEVFTGIEEHAENNNIDLFSYDMYRSHSAGIHWSYGVVYVRDTNKCINTFANFDVKKWDAARPNYSIMPINIDWFSTYLRDINALNIHAFYIDKMYFLHLQAPMLWGPSSLSHHHNGIVEYPVFKDIYKINHIRISYVPIFKDVIKLDFGLTEEEALNSMINNMFDYEQEVKWAHDYFPEYTR